MSRFRSIGAATILVGLALASQAWAATASAPRDRARAGTARSARGAETDGAVIQAVRAPGSTAAVELTSPTASFTLARSEERDGALRDLTYPGRPGLAAATVTYDRGAGGRLQAVRIGTTEVLRVDAYDHDHAPARLRLGTQGLERLDTYDHRRRLTGRAYRFTHPVTSARTVVADLRYAYDEADREIRRQDLHRGARAQLVAYDDASRVRSFEDDAIPSNFPGDDPRDLWLTPQPGFRQGRYQRGLTYDAAGHDHLADAVTRTATAAPAGQGLATGPFALSALGFITQTQAGSRSRDFHGQAQVIPSLLGGQLTLTHDARGRLTGVTRLDPSGLRTVTYTYRPDGVLLARSVTCPGSAPGCTPRDTTFVYDGLRLLEQHDTDAVLRFLYADDLDVPTAVDRIDTQGNTTRAYVVVDRQGSVRGLVDPDGQWREHVTYDLWGWPTRTAPEPNPPQVDALTTRGGTLVVAFTEPVLPAPQATPAPGGIFPLQSLREALELRDPLTGNTLAGTTRLRARAPGHELVFTPQNPPTPGVTYQLVAIPGRIIDAHGNPTAPGPLATLTWAADNRVLLDRGLGPNATTPLPLAASPFGHLLGFQSHLVDPDVGLLHMRGRVFDPHTGTFLELDPEGLVDSTNPYAGFAHDTVNHRDPTGMCVWEEDPQKQGECWSRAKTSYPAPRSCAKTIAAIMEGRPTTMDFVEASCVFHVYSSKDGVSEADLSKKKNGVNLHSDLLHRRMVAAFIRYALDETGGVPAAAKARIDGHRHASRSESILGRDAERYLWARSTGLYEQFYSRTQPVYERVKFLPVLEKLLRATGDPASAVGGDYFMERGRADQDCGPDEGPLFERSDQHPAARCGARTAPGRVDVGAIKAIPAFPVIGED